MDRPAYLQPGDMDRMMIMFVALMSEVAALRDRVDTHEALAEQGVGASSSTVETYELTAERQASRDAIREAMLKRVLRTITEAREAALDDVAAEGEDVHHAG